MIRSVLGQQIYKRLLKRLGRDVPTHVPDVTGDAGQARGKHTAEMSVLVCPPGAGSALAALGAEHWADGALLKPTMAFLRFSDNLVQQSHWVCIWLQGHFPPPH